MFGCRNGCRGGSNCDFGLPDWYLVGRPGLDPGTLGFDFWRPGASVFVHLSWSGRSVRPPTSAQVLTDLGVRLQEWLHEIGSGVVGVIRFVGCNGEMSRFNGETFELLIEE